ncbi:hypothetical protein [Brevibacillus sp. VP]|uniref:hypothetical protein n=1 Tax=unclassified Brevibacillus TaxID=2684853 RepID=UPI000E2FBEE0|nr:hypothetical protein [Brevibacillus sp. VP]RFB35441.1 hypothetical protein DZB91_07995 [Brevibacillus sp. VP]
MKNIFIFLIFSVLLTACSEQKIVYPEEEVKYLETMKEAIEQLDNYLLQFKVALNERKTDTTEENAKDVFSGTMAFYLINDVIQEVTPPKRFEEVHSKFQSAIGIMEEVSVSLITNRATSEEKSKFEKAEQTFNESSKEILDAYDDAVDSE